MSALSPQTDAKTRRLGLVKSHLEDSKKVTPDSIEEYRLLWEAFNVMYEAGFSELARTPYDQINEKDLVIHCAFKLEYSEWRELFEGSKLDVLLSIPPIFDERIFNRTDQKNDSKYRNLVRCAKRPFRGKSNEDKRTYEALIVLLYLVRCNLFHGFKTPDGPRDQEVMKATVPLLREIVTKLASRFLKEEISIEGEIPE
ncbi:hypothetical protein P9G84_02480 [Brevibacillus centrosporus]|uniref:hypothetical protein n=1 Tax=Brevibacillus centrosporus TaxID=54910 RepID=UPI0011449AB8|nr:hypothetical protein [Brevibacillus centrosporus]MEC2127860.1 hypothetical protein [Brevibacillus centrosporus]GED32102.1 hypothetical protein BCE02nite_32430 [Brevibacillus centrosporus]